MSYKFTELNAQEMTETNGGSHENLVQKATKEIISSLKITKYIEPLFGIKFKK